MFSTKHWPIFRVLNGAAYHSRPGFCGSRPTRLPIEPSELPERFPVPMIRQSRPEPTSDIDMTAVEHRAQLIRLVQQLPADQRRVIVERFVEQRSIREIAQQLGRTHGELPEVDGSLAPLLQIARQLRDLPRENFKPSLKSDLERTLSMATARQPIAAVRTFASPRLSYKSAAKAIEFYEKAFGAKDLERRSRGGSRPNLA